MNAMNVFINLLEAFEIEIVELLFPEIFDNIAWELGTESLDQELQEIQKDIFDKDSAEKIRHMKENNKLKMRCIFCVRQGSIMV